MTWCGLQTAIIVLLISLSPVTPAAQERFRVRSTHVEPGGKVSAVLEVPPGSAPAPSDFQLLIDDAPAIAAQDAKGQELNLMFLVDVSGSMKGAPLSDAKAAMAAFLPDIRPQDRLALTSFADDDKPQASFKDPRERMQQAIRGLETEGNKTLLYQALNNALKSSAASDPRTRRVFVVISDGKDEGSDVTLERVMADSKASLVPIYTVYRGKTEPPFRAILDLLANAAGGKYFFTRNEAEIGKTLQSIYDLEKSSLIVQFSYPAGAPGGATEKARIALKRPDGSLLTAQFPGAVPLPARTQQRAPLFWILLLVALLLCILLAWLWLRSRRKKPEPEQPVFIPPEPEPVTAAPPPRERRTTVIGHYFPAPGEGRPGALLRAADGPMQGREVPVEKEIYSIGAGADNDLAIEQDEYLSTAHAYLRYERGSWFIHDKDSRNGTFVNETQVPSSGTPLHPGDLIKLGHSTFEVVMPAG